MLQHVGSLEETEMMDLVEQRIRTLQIQRQNIFWRQYIYDKKQQRQQQQRN